MLYMDFYKKYVCKKHETHIGQKLRNIQDFKQLLDETVFTRKVLNNLTSCITVA